MIIFLYGQDTYRLRQKLKDLVSEFRKKYRRPYIKQFDARELNFEDFRSEFQTVSMFKEKRLVKITNVFSAPVFLEKITEFLRKIHETEDTLVFYEEGMPNTNNSLFKFLEKKAKIYKFELLSQVKLKYWIKKELIRYQVEADLDTLDALYEIGSDNLWLLASEIKKLATFVGRGNKAHLNDLEVLSKQKVETDIFATIDAISGNNKGKALELLHRHLHEGDSPLYLLSMLRNQISNLLIVKDLMTKGVPAPFIAKESGLHPFVAKKSLRISYKFTLSQLKEIYRKLFRYEIKIKTGKIDPVLALELLTVEI